MKYILNDVGFKEDKTINTRKELVEKVCKCCGAKFTTRSGVKVYCDPMCGELYYFYVKVGRSAESFRFSEAKLKRFKEMGKNLGGKFGV